MPHTGMVWYIPSRSSLDACLQARLGGLQALVGASVRRLAASGSTVREAWQGQHATKPHASLPWQLSTANPERVALALCRAWPRLAWLAPPRPRFLGPICPSSWRRLSPPAFPGKLARKRTLLWKRDGPTRGTPLLDCPCQDSPGAPHRPVLPGWSPLFAGSPRPIPPRGAHASLATALAREGRWSLPA